MDEKKTVFRRVLHTVFILIACMTFSTWTHAASIEVTGTIVDLTSYRIQLTESKSITHWRIRCAPDDSQKYKTIKTLKISKKSYTVKKLKKNKNYNFEIIGCKKKNGKLKAVKYTYLTCYTGLFPAYWDDYAHSDAPCSPNAIELWGNGGYLNDVPPEGYELYRKKDGEKVFTKIADLDSSGFPYIDKEVEAGATYTYRFRAYGK